MLGNWLKRGGRALREWFGSASRRGNRTGDHPMAREAEMRRFERENAPTDSLEHHTDTQAARYGTTRTLREIQIKIKTFGHSGNISQLVEDLPFLKRMMDDAIKQSEAMVENAQGALKKAKLTLVHASPKEKEKIQLLIKDFEEIVTISKRVHEKNQTTQKTLDKLSEIKDWDEASRTTLRTTIEKYANEVAENINNVYKEVQALGPVGVRVRTGWTELFPSVAFPLSLDSYEGQEFSWGNLAWSAFDATCLGLDAAEAYATLGLSIPINYVTDQALDTVTAPHVIEAVREAKLESLTPSNLIQMGKNGAENAFKAVSELGNTGNKAIQPSTWGVGGIIP